METLVDDIGSFPLPPHIEKRKFEEAYALAREWIAEGKDIRENEFLVKNFYEVVVASFKKKLDTGLDMVNYPQHYDMHRQFTEPIHKAMDEGTFVVDEKMAVIPEVRVISEEAKRLYEETGKKVALRVCVTGPMELYLKEVGATPYRDVLLMFAETVRRFAKNALLNSKYVKTEVVALDEPSFGFHEITAKKDLIKEVLEKAFDVSGVTRQIHTHSPSRIADILEVKNLNVVSIEYASSPRNIEYFSKTMLERADKQVRVGISRTDIDSIMAELYREGVTKPQVEQLVENEETIRKRFEKAKEKYGERMTFTGPDCGLGGWPTQEAAKLLLKRTVNAVKMCKK
jgi:5-methyltetrahydropteroyltriglutamate--homocysteine methyltransferase